MNFDQSFPRFLARMRAAKLQTERLDGKKLSASKQTDNDPGAQRPEPAQMLTNSYLCAPNIAKHTGAWSQYCRPFGHNIAKLRWETWQFAIKTHVINMNSSHGRNEFSLHSRLTLRLRWFQKRLNVLIEREREREKKTLEKCKKDPPFFIKAIARGERKGSLQNWSKDSISTRNFDLWPLFERTEVRGNWFPSYQFYVCKFSKCMLVDSFVSLFVSMSYVQFVQNAATNSMFI